VSANGRAEVVATLSGLSRYLNADDPSQIVVASGLEGRIAVVDSRSGRAVYVAALPPALVTSGEFISEVAAAPGRIAVASTGMTGTMGTHMILYRTRQAPSR
jgi:hypothetical protein